MFPKKALVGWEWDFSPSRLPGKHTGLQSKLKQPDNVLKCLEVQGDETERESEGGGL